MDDGKPQTIQTSSMQAKASPEPNNALFTKKDLGDSNPVINMDNAKQAPQVEAFLTSHTSLQEKNSVETILTPSIEPTKVAMKSLFKQPVSEQLSEAQRDLKSYDRALSRRPQDPDLHFVKAQTLETLFTETQKQEYQQQALQSLNTAVELAPQNPQYLIARALVYVKMNDTLAAKNDLDAFKKLPASDGVIGLDNSNQAKKIEHFLSTQHTSNYRESLRNINNESPSLSTDAELSQSLSTFKQ